MSLADRLGVEPRTAPRSSRPVTGAAGTDARRALRVQRGDPDPNQTAAAPTEPDPLGELKTRVQNELYSRLGPRLYDTALSATDLEALVLAELDRVLEFAAVSLSLGEQRHLVTAIRDDVLGLGPIQQFVEDPTVSEIMVNGSQTIYVERAGRLEKTSARFTSEAHLRRIIDKIVAQIGRRVDESSPMVDARLADGSRVNAIVAPLAVHGSSLTIRKFPERPLTIDDLVLGGSITAAAARFLQGCVAGGLNIVVSGGTGTGKTTMLNLLSSFIPPDERIVTIEDAVELRLDQENIVSLEARPSNSEGVGEVTIRDLVRNALRMRPDRIVVGECRGGEALDMLQAMNTGHEGSLTSAHANSPRDLLARLETMVLMAGLELPSRAIRDQIRSGIQVIVHLHRLHDGRRAVTSISEVTGMEEGCILLDEIFVFDWNASPYRDGLGPGRLVPTGVRPHYEDRLLDRGIALSAEMFDDAV